MKIIKTTKCGKSHQKKYLKKNLSRFFFLKLNKVNKNRLKSAIDRRAANGNKIDHETSNLCLQQVF